MPDIGSPDPSRRIANVHPSRLLTTPEGDQVTIDVDMIPLIEALWARGLRTAGCCQDLGESLLPATGRPNQGRRRHAEFYRGQAWLKMPTPDAQELLSLLHGHREFAERLSRWTDPQAWESYVYLLPDERGVGLSNWAQIHFPKQQTNSVVEMISVDR